MIVGHRSNRIGPLVVGALLFMVVFLGLAYNHTDRIDLYSSAETKGNRGTPDRAQQTWDDQLRDFYIKEVFKPEITVDNETYSVWGAFEHKLPSKPWWKKPLGENLCIIDLDNRPFREDNEIFGSHPMSWENSRSVHGLSLGVLNHWLYAKIHGYKYYFIEIEEYEDRRASWKKPPVMSELLKDHEACIYLDSDAIFRNLGLPFEWLMNYWEVNPESNSLALALDPPSDNNLDKFGKAYSNTGFIIAQNNVKTHEIFKAWEVCPDDGGKHPGCVNFRRAGLGSPTDQGGFGTYIRYDYPEEIKDLKCDEANGYTESGSNCNGLFIKHIWTGKDTWMKAAVGEQLPGKYLELFHQAFMDDINNFFFSEKELMKGVTHHRRAAKA